MYKAVKAHSRPFFFIFQRSVVLSGIHTLDGWHLDVQALLVVISDDRPGGAWGPTRAWISRASTFSDLAGLSPLAAGPATIFHHRLSFSAGQLSLLPFVGFSPFMGLYLSFWAWVCKAVWPFARWPVASPEGQTRPLEHVLEGLWAYDSASALARAVEKVGTANLTFEKANSSSALTDLETIGISQIGPKFGEALQATRFRGLGGQFSLVKGQLQSSTFQIINVNGNGERGVAFWTLEDGLRRKLNSASTHSYSTSKDNLGPITWPGEPRDVPKGWEIPTNGKKLKIEVPVKYGFNEFVDVTHDNSTNTTDASGYCIAVFQAVLGLLPSAVPNEFIHFTNPDGESTANYNDMAYQVFLGVVWVLEHRINSDFRAGDWSHQLGTSLWFAFSTLVFAQSLLRVDGPIILVVNFHHRSNVHSQAFPKGSPLVADFSRAILNFIEGNQTKGIEDFWLGPKKNCPDSNPQVSSGSLSLSSFSGLFLIAGVASVAALIFYVFKFLHSASELPQRTGSPPRPSNVSMQMESSLRNPGTPLLEDADPSVNIETSQVAATIELTHQTNSKGSRTTEIQEENL
ncbi:Glutamate receptor 2.3 [Morella rubra]|uniref:Glutamate receptor 2.3 n=1 Tax=Morella rubra TaxID=262757 RepID=A0A6A1WFA0_9ROSI|nr:Glutamate receptor 2.3 [Morella rubra]